MTRPNSENICFTTTAMPRPELLVKTYSSFKQYLPWLDLKKCPLFINVDYFPHYYEDHAQRVQSVIDIAKEHFGEVTANVQERGNFPAAVKWIFSNANREFVFNLEDDWELLCDIPEYVASFFDDPKIIQVGFRAWKKSDPRFVLSPSILKTSFCHKVAAEMHTKRNPEWQIRGLNPYKVEESFIYWPYEDNKIILRDLGRTWMKDTPFARGMDTWTSWEFVPNVLIRAREQLIQDQNSEIDISKLDGNFRGKDVPNN
jgi:hypothetical protein